MEIINISYPLTPDVIERCAKSQVLAIGQFDGLHLGHASVIESAVSLAARANLPASLMTFHPHPKEVMKKGDYEGYLTPPTQKEAILQQMGIDILYIVEFNDAFSRVSPHNFVVGMLLPLEVHTAVVGFDFRFGYQGEGHADMLHNLSEGALEVVTMPPFLIDGEKASSSSIRKYLQEGNIEEANRLLGRPYVLSGTVVGGEKRGRTIGFPTANIQLDEYFVLPSKGVYAVNVTYDGNKISGVMNIGVKPTFHSDGYAPSIEVHLLDFSKEIYDQTLTVELIRYIREERKFGSIDELIAQITKDTMTARQLLAEV